MKMLKLRGNKILKSTCRGVQMLARDISNLSSNERSSHVLQMLLEDVSIWNRLDSSTRSLLATAVALNVCIFTCIFNRICSQPCMESTVE